MKSIYSIKREDLEEYFVSKGDKKFRATQVFEWLYRKKAKSFEEMTNLNKKTIEMLNSEFYFDTLKLVKKQEDNLVKKYLFELNVDNRIESVLM